MAQSKLQRHPIYAVYILETRLLIIILGNLDARVIDNRVQIKVEV